MIKGEQEILEMGYEKVRNNLFIKRNMGRYLVFTKCSYCKSIEGPRSYERLPSNLEWRCDYCSCTHKILLSRVVLLNKLEQGEKGGKFLTI